MERLGILISKLQEQYQQKMPVSQMMLTIQMIQQELASTSQPVTENRSKVSVVMPASMPVRQPAYIPVEQPVQTPVAQNAPVIQMEQGVAAAAPVEVVPPAKQLVLQAPELFAPEKEAAPAQQETPAQPAVEAQAPVVHTQQPQVETHIPTIQVQTQQPQAEAPPAMQNRQETAEPQPSVTASAPPATQYQPATQPSIPVIQPTAAPSETAAVPAPKVPAVPAQPQIPDAYDPLMEVPTLSHQKEVKIIVELNDAIATKVESLNERLRAVHPDLGSKLNETPVKDLRKAIGINERFVYINELFRGDESMYERSLKTINNFHIFPEAEYWMERELKIKLGWNDSTPSVKQFYQVVKRRFA